MKEQNSTVSAVRPWYKVDNASNMYCFARSQKFSRTYRNSVTLDEDVDIDILQAALEKTAKRYPTMNTVLRNGVFWAFLEHTDNVPKIEVENCRPGRYIIHNGESTPCYRVNVYKNRISTDFFHGVTDGSGSFDFLRTLVTTYFELKGTKIESYGSVRNAADEPTLGEIRDSYFDYADKTANVNKPAPEELFIGENEQIDNFMKLIHGRFPVADVRTAAKKYSLTITEYLAAVMILMYIKCPPEPIDKPIIISIPVDLRRRFESESVRDFVFMTGVKFNPEGRTDVEFTEIADAIRGMAAKKTTKEALLNAVNTNVASERRLITSVVPYPIKSVVMKKSYEQMQYSYTTILSNIGSLEFPPEVAPHVVEADACLGKTPYLHFGCAAVSLNGIFNLTFTSGNENTDRQKFFFRFLANDGVRVRVDASK